MDPVGQLLTEIVKTRPHDRAALRQLKVRLATRSGQPLIRNDALLARYRRDVTSGTRRPDEQLERTLRLNDVRSQSGIATVTVITEPFPCPGRCVYCPTEARAPKSYLTNEPAVMRAIRNDYDPFRQVVSRLQALEETGHPTDKIELIIKGGTWSFYPDAYQREFIQRCFEAANNFASGSPARLAASEPGRARLPGPSGSFRAGAGQAPSKSRHPAACSLQPAALTEVQRVNETAKHRLIGITIETRPDYVTEEEIARLRELGVTRVELGVQSLDRSVLELIVRDHATREVRHATKLLKDAGFKVAYHLMPNLPGATPESDLKSARRLFMDPAYQPDTLKLYPCVVVETAELFQWWKAGRYEPYDDETLVELLIQIKRHVPPYVRIERVIRDIPSTSIRAGCQITNLREEVQRRMRERGLACRCIRCRQVREPAPGDCTLIRRTYHASDGIEVFLSFEDPMTDRLASLLRLRMPSPALAKQPHWLTALNGCALIRELHTYGQHLALHHHAEGAAQHRGFGSRLLKEAERITREEFGLKRLAVIAGVGVREYYRRFGYERHDTYMVKTLVLR